MGTLTALVQVILYKSTENEAGESTPLTLEKVAEWNHNHFVTNVVIDGEHILVGDAISSVSVLRWNERLERLESIARDYGPLWPIAIEGTGNGIIGANVRGFLTSSDLVLNCVLSVGRLQPILILATEDSAPDIPRERRRLSSR